MDTETPAVTHLVIEHDDIAAVLTTLEQGHVVRAKIVVGDRRASPQVLNHLQHEVERLGARFVHEPANDVNPGDRWRRVEPPHGTSRDRAAISA